MTTTTSETTTPAAPALDEETRRVLARAKGIVANGWCQGPERCWRPGTTCLLGAIAKAIGDDVLWWDDATTGQYARVLGFGDDDWSAVHDVWQWNDAPGRTQAEVVALFDKALGA